MAEDQAMTLTIAQRQHMAVMTLAMQAAKKVVEKQLRSTGRRLPDVDHKEIMTLANDYLTQHPTELIAEAKETVDLWQRQGRFGPRGGFRSR
jgi:hypothetical protein